MTDDIVKKLYDKYLKNWFKRNYKFIVTILLYILYQSNFLISLVESLGLNIAKMAITPRVLCFFINDIIYIIILILLFKKEIINGLKDLKQNFTERAILSLNCWIVGCILMTASSVIISLILKQEVSTNEALVRQSIQLAPIYMLFTCSVLAPIFEELVFRRSLYGLIKHKWLFIIISGLGFGLLHVLGSYNSFQDFLYVIPYGSMGCAFAYLLTKTNNITLPIIIHMLHNTILVTAQIIGG